MIRKYQNTIFRTIIVILLLFLQVLCVFLLSEWLKDNAVYAYVIIEICSILLMCSLVSDNINAYYKIVWLGVVLLLPISGHIMYELWGKEGAKKKHHKRIQDTIDYYKNIKQPDSELQSRIRETGIQNGKISDYLSNSGYPAYENTEMTYFSVGEKAFKSLAEDLKNAQKFILLSFFTIADGRLWDGCSEILIEKARQGVEVKIMYDDAGSIFQLSDAGIKQLKREHIQIRKFNSIEKNLSRQYFQYRNHQKIAVIDGNISYTGGLNISDRYANVNSPFGHWKDVAVRMKGEATWGMTLTFFGMWDTKCELKDVERYRPDFKGKSNGICQPYADGPSNNPDNPARNLYHLLANMAQKELLIMTPYLILDDETRDCLCLAAKSGVNVKIITPGIPDKKGTKLLTEWNYGMLLASGIQIYEYTKGFVHAKLCLNDMSAFVGTVNMDFRSFYLHYECGVWFTKSSAWEQVYSDFYHTLSECREITLEAWQKRPFWVKAGQLLLQSIRSQF